MTQKTNKQPFAVFLATLFLSFSLCVAQEPEALYLTWKENPCTTMTIVWHSVKGLSPHALFVKRSDETTWKTSSFTEEAVVGSSIVVFQTTLTDLRPATDYLFRLDDGPVHLFQTLPDQLDRPLRVAVGGDAYQETPIFIQMNALVASQAPDFVILGGDIAYAEGLSTALKTHLWRVERWEQFFRLWTKQLVTPDGRMIPLLCTLGNHDVKEGFDHPTRHKVLFYQMVPLPEAGIPYQKVKIGQDVCFFLLDSGHSHPPGGKQAAWLEKELKAEATTPYKVPVYHIGAYPSDTSYMHRGSVELRTEWVPLFEKYGVNVCMEHDSHTFKRTFPIREGKVDRLQGIVYLGDGAWGVTPIQPRRLWYLAKAAGFQCYWLITFTQEKAVYQAFNLEGTLIDQIEVVR